MLCTSTFCKVTHNPMVNVFFCINRLNKMKDNSHKSHLHKKIIAVYIRQDIKPLGRDVLFVTKLGNHTRYFILYIKKA